MTSPQRLILDMMRRARQWHLVSQQGSWEARAYERGRCDGYVNAAQAIAITTYGRALRFRPEVYGRCHC